MNELTPDQLSALAGSAAMLNVGYTVFGLLVLAAVFAFLAGLGERAMGLNLRKFIDNVEKAADRDRLWPGIVAFVLAPAGVLCLVLFIGLR